MPGRGWSIMKTPMWKTWTKESVSGREARARFMLYPLWRISLTYNVLRASAFYEEYQRLVGFFNLRSGAFDTFLFDDTTDNTVLTHLFGVGDGVTTTFQLIRSLGGFVEPIENVNGAAHIFVGGALQHEGIHYTRSPTGVITFFGPPVAGTNLEWSGHFYYRCRFLDDQLDDMENFMHELWALRRLEFKGAPGNKVG